MRLVSIMPSAAEIAVRKYLACASNDFRDRFCPVGKSSRKAALFYLSFQYANEVSLSAPTARHYLGKYCAAYNYICHMLTEYSFNAFKKSHPYTLVGKN